MNTRKPKNRREAYVYDHAINKGWNILNKGWPDFILYKKDKIMFVEVKTKGQKTLNTNRRKEGLSPHQLKMKEILGRYFKYVVLYVD